MRPASRFSLALAVVYTLLAVYASLHPLSGWSDSGVDPFDFLEAGWPRYHTAFDIAINVLAYAPLGLLWCAVLLPRVGAAGAIVLAALGGMALSLGMEMLQNYLPTRVPSKLDLACNAVGALIGALSGARWGRQLIDGGRLHDWRERRFIAGGIGDAGLLLLGLWWLTQFTPDTLPLGNGDLRSLLGLPPALSYSAGRFAGIEAALVGAHTLALALLVARLNSARRWRPVVGLVGAGLAAKTLVFALSLGATRAFDWVTHASVAGLALGLGAGLLATALPGRLQQTLAALALLVATTLVNLAPENPYLANTWHTWNPGQFLNFHGLTKWLSSLWPFLALPWLIMPQSEKP